MQILCHKVISGIQASFTNIHIHSIIVFPQDFPAQAPRLPVPSYRLGQHRYLLLQHGRFALTNRYFLYLFLKDTFAPPSSPLSSVSQFIGDARISQEPPPVVLPCAYFGPTNSCRSHHVIAIPTDKWLLRPLHGCLQHSNYRLYFF